jgi:hypothetical protein
VNTKAAAATSRTPVRRHPLSTTVPASQRTSQRLRIREQLAERLRSGQPREAVLCAWGICGDEAKVLLHLAPGTKEDTESCRAFFQDLKRRGLPEPLPVVTDGAPGLIRA